MHATVAELLELRDGDPGPGIAEHVAACPECAAELDQLRRLRDALAGMGWEVRDTPQGQTCKRN